MEQLHHRDLLLEAADEGGPAVAYEMFQDLKNLRDEIARQTEAIANQVPDLDLLVADVYKASNRPS